MAHDEAAKARARDAYRQGGGAHAARITGIPLRTIQRWATEGGWVHELAPLEPGNGAGGNGAPEPAGSKNGPSLAKSPAAGQREAPAGETESRALTRTVSKPRV